MLRIKLIAVGSLKEPYWRAALSEYEKRLAAYAKFEVVELKECRISDAPSPAEIENALEKEADAVFAALPPRAFLAALCVEGKQISSEELSALLSRAGETHGEIAFVIGSSFGLSPRVKRAAHFSLSLSALTFPHQMARVILAETLYRSLSILSGGKYHK